MAFQPIEYLKEKFNNLKTPDGKDFSDLIDSCYNLSVTGLSSNFIFSVNGSISANNFVFDKNGNSEEWNSTYTNVQANSTLWGSEFGVDTAVRSLTSNWQNTFTTVQGNSSTWDYQGSDIKSLTGEWVGGNAAYTNLVSNSAAYLSGVDLSFLSVSGDWNSAYTTVWSKSANWDAAFSSAGADLSVRSLTANWQNTFTTVQGNSSTWDYQGSDIKSLSGGWVGGFSSYTTVQANSALWAIDNSTDTGVRSLTSNWESTHTTVQGNSSTWNYQGNDIKNLSAGWVGGNEAYTNLVANSAAYLSAVNLSFLSVSGNWNSVYSTVNSNSALWDYQGSDIKALTGGWVGGYLAYTNLVTNSAAYLSAVDISFLSVSGNWNSTYTTVQANSALWAIDNSTDTGVRSLTSNWESTYTTVQNNSSTYWNYQGTDLKNLSSSWVGGNDAYTNLVSNSAAYLSGVDLGFLSISANWDSVYSTVNSNSANWDYQGSDIKSLTAEWVGGNSVFTTVQTNSSNWDYQGSDIKSLTADWTGGNIAYTNLVSNSSSYLSGYDLSFLSVSANWNSVYTTVQENSATTWNYQGTDLKVLSANWQSAYTTTTSNSSKWDSVYTSYNTSSATLVNTVATTTAGTSAVTTIVAVSALPVTQIAGTLYILI